MAVLLTGRSREQSVETVETPVSGDPSQPVTHQPDTVTGRVRRDH